MKKLIFLVLALVLCLSLAACGGAGNETADSADSADTAGSAQNNADNGQNTSDDGQAAESDLQYIKDKGTLIVGMTDFAPMDYRDESGEWIGFDADMAKAFGEYLGVDVEFLEITWSSKLMELDTKGIDVIWNGMTINDEVNEDYQTVESLSGLNFAVEDGSAGAEQLDLLGLSYIGKTTQADALMEVASGASDACVIDLLMAGAMIGEGTSYPDLTYTVQLNSEEYGVAFRTGSDLVDQFNTFWKEAYDAGTVMETATTYGVQESVIEK